MLTSFFKSYIYIYIYNRHNIEVVITKSKKPDKTYDAVIDGKNKISFGASGYSDFTKHGDTYRKEAYINIHSQ